MAVDLGLAAANITAALISSSAVTIKGKDSKDTVKRAVGLYSSVFHELMEHAREGKLFKES